VWVSSGKIDKIDKNLPLIYTSSTSYIGAIRAAR